MADVRMCGKGALCLLVPVTQAAREWLIANGSPAWQWVSGGVAVRRQYAGPIVDVMISDGLEVEV